jgi:ArsR family transcriptional regulator, arsenate/arsenite/antimonite-responsive transcriptional repressor
MTSMQTFFIALADRTRRRILNLMRDEEISVGDFSSILEISQPMISRHLAYLKNAGIVSARRDGKAIYYRITEPEDSYAARVLQDTLGWLESRGGMQKDYKKLKPGSAPKRKVAAPILKESKEENILPEADMFAEREAEVSVEQEQETETYAEREEMETYLL